LTEKRKRSLIGGKSAASGNRDNALGFDLDCRCMGSFREHLLATRAWHRTLVSETDGEFLRAMPTLHWFEWGGHVPHLLHTGTGFDSLPGRDGERKPRSTQGTQGGGKAEQSEPK